MKLSFVIPVFNGEKTIERLTDKICQQINGQAEFEIIFVNDCAMDNSWSIIEKLIHENKGNIKAIKLDKNRGQHYATLLGLLNTSGDIAITLDEDLQYDPCEILKLVNILKIGNYHMVYGTPETITHNKVRRIGSSILKKLLLFSNTNIHPDYSSLRIIEKSLINGLKSAECPYFFIDACLSKKETRITSEKVTSTQRENGRSSYTVTKLIIHFLKLVFSYTKLLIWISLCSYIISGVLILAITLNFIRSSEIFLIPTLLFIGTLASFLKYEIGRKSCKRIFNSEALKYEIMYQ